MVACGFRYASLTIDNKHRIFFNRFTISIKQAGAAIKQAGAAIKLKLAYKLLYTYFLVNVS